MLNRPYLTARQRQIFDFIVDQIGLSGYPPTIREIGLHVGIRSTNGVADHLKALKRKGYLKQQGFKSRTWQPIAEVAAQVQAQAEPDKLAGAQTQKSAPLRAIPLLGRVAAGEPILAVEAAMGDICVDASWVGRGQDVFALIVAGDSMIDDGILDGDTIFVTRQDDARPGEIIVVMIDNEATVKRFYPEGDRVRLQPANKAMQPIMLTAHEALNVRIVGCVTGVWRRL